MKATILVLLLCVSAALASQCLGLPKPSSKKQSCGEVGCRLGYYCDKVSICSDRIPVGGACIDSLQPCVFGAVCKGPENAKTCVAYGNPGQDCSTSNSDTLPTCANVLSCSFSGKKCTGGAYKDKCTDAKDCASNICTNGLCDSLALNATCSREVDSCGPDMYCDGDFFNGYSCVPRLSLGAECPSDESCPLKTVCIGKTPESIPVCTALKTVEAGGYCGGYHNLCTSGICNEYCAEKLPEVCSDTETLNFCGDSRVCTCGSSLRSRGTGKCSSFKCLKAANTLSDCLTDKCKVYYYPPSVVRSSTLFSYSNSCASQNCRSEFDDYIGCVDSQYSIDITVVEFDE